MYQPTHHHLRATATLGVLALIASGIAITAFVVRHDGTAIAAFIVGAMLGIGFWFRWTASIAEITILDLLASGGWWNAPELVDQSVGVLQRGTVHVHLQNLQDRGLIRSRLPSIYERTDDLHIGPPKVQARAPRRLYALVINRPPIVAGKDTP